MQFGVNKILDLGQLRAPNTGAGSNGAPGGGLPPQQGLGQPPRLAVAVKEDVVVEHPRLSGGFKELTLDPKLLLLNRSVTTASDDLGRFWADFHIDNLFEEVLANQASDLHLAAWKRPMMRVNGVLAPIQGLPAIPKDIMQRLIYAVISDEQINRYETTKDLDCSHALPRGGPRFRVNIAQAIDGIAVTARMIPLKVPEIKELGLPAIFEQTALNTRRGLVLVTGVTGSGKSTTLAAMINAINQTRRDNILTMEDPIEYVHTDKLSKIIQREIGTDSKSFNNALRAALRQDPEVILVGEMRDAETISQAITAAETGHLVLATLHTKTASSSIERIVDSFDPEQQAQVRVQLSQNLQAVFCQQLLPVAHGSGRVAATEVMVCNPAIRNLIREGKAQQIPNAIQMGGKEQMITMDGCLAMLVRSGRITQDKAMEYAVDRDDLKKLLATGTAGDSVGGNGSVRILS